jgi:hypothetical protein
MLLPALLSLGPVSAQRFLVGVSQKLPEHDTIVVADVSDVSRAPAVGGIEVRATLSVRRAIQGTLAAGAAIPVTWYETPTAFGNSGFNVLPSGRSLWLLQKAADGGRYDPVQLGPFGVLDVPQYYYLPLPAEDLSADFSRLPGDTVDARLARELGFALEALARNEGAGLNVRRVWAPSGALSVYGSGDTFLFGRTVALLWQFRPADARPLFDRFQASTLPNLRTVGLAGLLRLGEVSAIAKLERDAEALAPTTEAERIPGAIDELADLPLGRGPVALPNRCGETGDAGPRIMRPVPAGRKRAARGSSVCRRHAREFEPLHARRSRHGFLPYASPAQLGRPSAREILGSGDGGLLFERFSG